MKATNFLIDPQPMERSHLAPWIGRSRNRSEIIFGSMAMVSFAGAEVRCSGDGLESMACSARLYIRRRADAGSADGTNMAVIGAAAATEHA